MALLDVKNLCVDFHTDQGTVHAVRDISFSVGESEAVGIVGESGSGKSVTMYSVMGLLAEPGHVAGGSMEFEGKDLVHLSERDYRALRGNDMAMIFQEPMTSLNPVYRVGKQIVEAIRTHGSYGQMLSCYLAQLILTLGDDGVIAAATQTPETAIFSKAVVYMNQQVCRNPSVSAIAAHCNISETGLKRIFTKYAGIGIHKYFMHLKFKAAAALLKEGMGVTETAEKLGFSDQGYFSKAFKRELGVSPSALKGQKGSAV